MRGASVLRLLAAMVAVTAVLSIPTPERVCARQHCPQHMVCVADRRLNTRCVCPVTCPEDYSPVCGSDRITYDNACQLDAKACSAKVKVDVASLGPCPEDEVTDVLDLEFYGILEGDAVEESIVDFDLEFGIPLNDEDDEDDVDFDDDDAATFYVDLIDGDDDFIAEATEDGEGDEATEHEDDDLADDDDADDEALSTEAPLAKKGKKWRKRKGQRGNVGSPKGGQRGHWKKKMGKLEGASDESPMRQGKRAQKGHRAHKKHMKRLAWKLKRKAMHMKKLKAMYRKKMNMTSDEKSEFVCKRVQDDKKRGQRLLQTLSVEERQAWEDIWKQRREELQKCCQQNEEPVSECLDRVRESHWEHVCSGEESMAPWRTPTSNIDLEEIIESCCADEVNSTATCFKDQLTGRRRFLKMTSSFDKHASLEDRIDSVCERVTADDVTAERPRGHRFGGVSNETRFNFEASWLERREQMQLCCELDSEDRVACVEDVRAARYDRVCDGEEELHLGRGRHHRAHLRDAATEKCCSLEEAERYDCFETLRVTRRGWRRHHVNETEWIEIGSQDNKAAADIVHARATCTLPAVVGHCRAAMPRFYFDQTSGLCLQFLYGGCGGNENNFLTEEECLHICADGELDEDDGVESEVDKEEEEWDKTQDLEDLLEEEEELKDNDENLLTAVETLERESFQDDDDDLSMDDEDEDDDDLSMDDEDEDVDEEEDLETGGGGRLGNCCEAGRVAARHVRGPRKNHCIVAARAFAGDGPKRRGFCEKKFRHCCNKATAGEVPASTGEAGAPSRPRTAGPKKKPAGIRKKQHQRRKHQRHGRRGPNVKPT